jgi:hypothetical protein
MAITNQLFKFRMEVMNIPTRYVWYNIVQHLQTANSYATVRNFEIMSDEFIVAWNKSVLM